MTKKNITIIAALSAVVLLTAAYFGFEAYRRANPPPSPWDSFDFETPPVIASFEFDKINRIENILQGFSLVRDGENWVLVSDSINTDNINISQDMILNRLWYFSNIWSEALIDEDPQDISIFGLDDPTGRVFIGDSDGNTAEIIIGNMNPSRNAFYVMLAGQQEVYTLSSFLAQNINLGINDLRSRELLGNLAMEYTTNFVIEYRPGDYFFDRRRMEMIVKAEDNPYVSSFTEFMMIAPYAGSYGVDSNVFWRVLESMLQIEVTGFADDSPSSLAPYGLDNPGRIYVNSATGSFEIFYGRSEGDLRYAKFPDNSAVLLVSGLESIINTSPFELMDKFVLLHHIDNIDSFAVTTEGRTLTGTIDGQGDDIIVHLNGRRASVREFRGFYQAVIGLLKDTELSRTITSTVTPDAASREQILIEYWHNTPPGLHSSVRLIPYNRDFYLIEKQGVSEFLIARTQVRRIFESAENMVYLE